MYLPSDPTGSACFWATPPASCSLAWHRAACRAQQLAGPGMTPGSTPGPALNTSPVLLTSRRKRASPWCSVGLPGSTTRSFQELKHDTRFCACVLRVWLKDRGSVAPRASMSLPISALPCSVGLAGLGWGVPGAGHRLVLWEACLAVWHRVSRLCWGASSLHSLLHKLMLY